MTHIQQGLSNQQIGELASLTGQPVKLYCRDSYITGTLGGVYEPTLQDPEKVLRLNNARYFDYSDKWQMSAGVDRVPLALVTRFEKLGSPVEPLNWSSLHNPSWDRMR
jgi:hypothetical protein